jgi:hypothetical protein
MAVGVLLSNNLVVLEGWEISNEIARWLGGTSRGVCSDFGSGAKCDALQTIWAPI